MNSRNAWRIVGVVAMVALLAAIGKIVWDAKSVPVNNAQDSKKNQKIQHKQEEEEQKEGPLSFWTGEVIVGEGPNRGKLELVAAPGKKAVVLTADEKGVCLFDDIPGMKPGEMYIKLQKKGHAPLISLAEFEGGKEVEMNPVYQLSDAVKKGKITPLIAPDIMAPAERKYCEKGQVLEGYTWHICSYDKQVYGYEKKTKPVNSYSTAVELTPPVKVILEPYEIDLTKKYLSKERLDEMAQEDKKFEGYTQKNGLEEFKTSAGTFKVVTCYGRQSTDSNAKYSGGWRHSTMQLPSGKWTYDWLGIQKTVDLEGQLYLICRHRVLKYVGNDKLECVATFKGLEGKWAPYISVSKDQDGFYAGRYLAVNKSSDSNFGGLLEYREGKWLFHQYNGDYGSWVDSVEEKGDTLILTLFNWNEKKTGKRIQFNTGNGTFTDL